MRASWLWVVIAAACAGCSGPTGYLERDGAVYWAGYPGTSGFPTLERVERQLDADPATFKIEPFPDWASDRDHVYYRGHIVGAVDQPSFSARSADLAADVRSVWLDGQRVEGADPVTFRQLAERYAVDANRAYYGWTGFEVCELASLRIDGRGVDTFAIDDECVFAGSFAVPVQDRESFEVIGAGYTRDRYQVYWLQFVVEGADPRSFFVPAGMRYGRDASSCWSGVRRIECLN